MSRTGRRFVEPREDDRRFFLGSTVAIHYRCELACAHDGCIQNAIRELDENIDAIAREHCCFITIRHGEVLTNQPHAIHGRITLIDRWGVTRSLN